MSVELRRFEAGVRFKCANAHRWTIWNADFKPGGRFEVDVAAAEICPVCRGGARGVVELVRRTVR